MRKLTLKICNFVDISNTLWRSQQCSGARYHALAVIDFVCIDYIRVYYDHVNTTPDKAKFFSINSRLLFTFCCTRYSGAALCKLTLQAINYMFAASTPVHRVEYKPPLH
jgi:hypothetical protein